MDLAELEVVAGRLLEEQKRLRAIDSELAILKQEIKEMPRRAEKDRSFYALIGLDWTEPGHVSRKDELERERKAVLASIGEANEKIMKGLSSRGLVIPLEPTPTVEGGFFVFRFRSSATFPKVIEELSEILGIPAPLKIGAVTISPDRVVVAEADQYFAKERIVEAFDDVRKTVELKLSSHR